MGRFKGIKGMIILAVLIIGLISYYFYLSNKTAPSEEQDVISSEVSEVLLRDLERNYPPTPKEVVRLYSQITKCFYNEKYTDNQLVQLSKQSIRLLDQQLVDNQGDYLEDLKIAIQEFREQEFTISDFTTSSSIDIENEKFREDGYEWTRVYCTYRIKLNKVTNLVEQVYLLRKDESGYWKIFGWDLIEEVK